MQNECENKLNTLLHLTALMCLTLVVLTMSLFINKDIYDTKVSETEAENTGSCAGSRVEFVNVMGLNGFYLEIPKDDGFVRRDYFVVIGDHDEYIKIAESCGKEIKDYRDDIDGDGKRELICSCTNSDGEKYVLVFREYNGTILCGTLKPFFEFTDEYSNISSVYDEGTAFFGFTYSFNGGNLSGILEPYDSTHFEWSEYACLSADSVKEM